MSKIIHYSKAQMEKDLLDIARQMAKDNWKPDLIIGPARGGLVPATMLSHYYDVKMLPVNLSLRDFKTDLEKVKIEIDNLCQYQNILVVDDIVDSGDTLQMLKKILNNQIDKCTDELFPTIKRFDLKFASLYYNLSNRAKFVADYYVNEINKAEGEDSPWIVFPEEYWWKAVS